MSAEQLASRLREQFQSRDFRVVHDISSLFYGFETYRLLDADNRFEHLLTNRIVELAIQTSQRRVRRFRTDPREVFLSDFIPPIVTIWNEVAGRGPAELPTELLGIIRDCCPWCGE
jgi:hypothetical protein